MQAPQARRYVRSAVPVKSRKMEMQVVLCILQSNTRADYYALDVKVRMLGRALPRQRMLVRFQDPIYADARARAWDRTFQVVCAGCSD